eukprot:GHVU01017799.1.p1 GENE.GHVU01017799.1~~GHVU01017799.1.p1  ORF type:complete len:127 (+),score=13.05 GHVU01017799.1:91-471(+)
MDGMDGCGWGGVDAWLLATTYYYYGYTGILLALPSSLPPQVCCSALAVAFTVATGERLSQHVGGPAPTPTAVSSWGEEQGSFEVWWAAMLVMFGYPRQYCCPSMYVAMMMCIGWQSKGCEYKYECE